MCLPLFFSDLGGCLQGVFIFLICVICAGPILIILGIVTLTEHNGRGNEVKAYNTQGNAYNGGDYLVWPRVSGNVADSTASANNTYAMTLFNNPEPVLGSMDGVNSYSHYTINASGLPQATSNTYTVTLVVAANATQAAQTSTLQLSIPFVATSTITLTCAMTCNGCSGDCNVRTVESYCNNVYLGSYSNSNSGSCSDNDACGTCTFSGQLSGACVVVTFAADNTITRSTAYTSCYYPFNNYQYIPGTSSSFMLSLMSDQDPYLTLASTTSGSLDFGQTTKSQNTNGAVYLVVGIVIVIIDGLIIYCFVRSRQNRQPRPVAAAPAEIVVVEPVRAYPPQPPPHYQQRPPYGQAPVYTNHPYQGQQPVYYGQPGYYRQPTGQPAQPVAKKQPVDP